MHRSKYRSYAFFWYNWCSFNLYFPSYMPLDWCWFIIGSTTVIHWNCHKCFFCSGIVTNIYYLCIARAYTSKFHRNKKTKQESTSAKHLKLIVTTYYTTPSISLRRAQENNDHTKFQPTIHNYFETSPCPILTGIPIQNKTNKKEFLCLEV